MQVFCSALGRTRTCGLLIRSLIEFVLMCSFSLANCAKKGEISTSLLTFILTCSD
jgi:hypothetical protein